MKLSTKIIRTKTEKTQNETENKTENIKNINIINKIKSNWHHVNSKSLPINKPKRRM